MRAAFRSFGHNQRGATAIEMGLVLVPVILVFLFGAIQLSIVAYAQSSLEAAIRDTSRTNITGQGGAELSRIQAMQTRLNTAMNGFPSTVPATPRFNRVTITTRVYDNFDQVGQPEPWTDSDRNGRCNRNEQYQDINGNGRWDTDMARAGLGGPLDVVAYTATFPMKLSLGFFLPIANRTSMTLSATTVIRNEPFGQSVSVTGAPLRC
jgi:Flp pilus assembly pilin Flp